MEVTITQEHCKKAPYGNPHGCPLYLAIKEQFPDLQNFWAVGGDWITYKDEKGTYTFKDFNHHVWNLDKCRALRDGKIESITLIINN